MHRFKWFCAVLCLAVVLPVQAAHTRADLLLDMDTVKPGSTVTAGIRLRMDSGWHTYWLNPGSSGIATKVKWEIPQSLRPEKMLWPLPEKLVEKDATSYIYKGEVLILVPIKVDAAAKPGKLELKANVSWLECEIL